MSLFVDWYIVPKELPICIKSYPFALKYIIEVYIPLFAINIISSYLI